MKLLTSLSLASNSTRRVLKRPCRKFMSVSAAKDSKLPWLEPNLDDVKTQLQNYKGGQLTLTQDNSTGIAYLCIDHVNNKNSLSGKMMVDLHNAILQLEKWDEGKGVILHSSGGTFCSGGFLDTIKKLRKPEDGFRMACLMHDSLIRLSSLPLISVAVVQGKALGGGSELLLWTDFRKFTEDAEVGYVQAKMGITTGWGGGTLLKKLVGHQKAINLLLSNRIIKTDEALSIGLADGTVSQERPLEDAVSWLNSIILSHPPSVVHAAKRVLACNELKEERQILASVWGGTAQQTMLAKNIKHK